MERRKNRRGHERKYSKLIGQMNLFELGLEYMHLYLKVHRVATKMIFMYALLIPAVTVIKIKTDHPFVHVFKYGWTALIISVLAIFIFNKPEQEKKAHFIGVDRRKKPR